MCWPFRKRKKKHKNIPLISIIVPFKSDEAERTRNWNWLQKFYMYNLPEAEILLGLDPDSDFDDTRSRPFSKSVAVNNAARCARGQIYVIMDADTFIDPTVIQDCAKRIIKAEQKNRRLWFVPYRNLYRLTRRATDEVIEQNPHQSFFISSPPPQDWIDPSTRPSYGHLFGAMIMILPAEAFNAVKGFDCRFRGWGGEDASFMRTVDTLYAPHEVTPNDVLHLWHRHTEGAVRKWEGQERLSPNARLTQRYTQASNDPTLMQAIIEEKEE